MKQFVILLSLFAFSAITICDGQTKRSITIAGYSFVPTVLTIFPGDTVEWTNSDIVSHTATSDSSVWDTGTLAPNATGSHVFKKIGTFPYHCDIHTFMIAKIIVTDITPVDEPLWPAPHFSLSTIAPNPMHDHGSISVSLGAQSFITVTLFNTVGHELGTIIEGTFTEGKHSFPVVMHGLPAGGYIYKLKAFDRRGKLLYEKSKSFVLMQ